MLPVREISLSLGNRIARAAWSVVWLFLFRPTPAPLHIWRRLLLRLFGATIGRGALPYPSAKIWAPWNLVMGTQSCIGRDVDCYCVAKVTIGDRAVISQYSYLCAGTHHPDHVGIPMPLLAGPIEIGADVWIAADVFVGPGVTIGIGAMVGARSTVLSDIPKWKIAVGSPAKVIKERGY